MKITLCGKLKLQEEIPSIGRQFDKNNIYKICGYKKISEGLRFFF